MKKNPAYLPSDASPAMTPDAIVARRRWLWGAGGVAALAVGAGLSWQQVRRPAPAVADSQAGALQALWAGQWPTPSGPPLALATLKGRPLIVNFWASWCPPCIEELPLLEVFYRQQAANGWQIAALAIDQMPQVQRLLARMPLGFAVAVIGHGGLELVRALGNVSGGLPFTLALDAQGGVIARKMGRIRPADLSNWVQAAAASGPG